jgi:hypothetical protein
MRLRLWAEGKPFGSSAGGRRAGQGRTYGAGMDRVLRLWSAVSWWLVPLAITALGAVGIGQHDSLFSEGTNTTYSGPAAVHAGSCCWSRSRCAGGSGRR